MTRGRARRICCAGRWPACRSGPATGGRVALRADAGYFAGQLARAAHEERIAFAIGAKRIAPLWRLLDGIAEDDWREAIGMENAQVAVADYRPDWWPAGTSLLIRRVRLDPAQVSADPRSRRRRTLHPAQRALPAARARCRRCDLRLLLHPDQPRRVHARARPPPPSTGTGTAPPSRRASLSAVIAVAGRHRWGLLPLRRA